MATHRGTRGAGEEVTLWQSRDGEGDGLELGGEGEEEL